MKRLTNIEEILRILEERGLSPIRMDDELPVFDAQVSCGLPNGVGDVSSSMKGSPSLLRRLGAEYAVHAHGDSMVGAGVDDGDILYIDCRAEIHDGDMVLAMPESGEYLIKIFYTDWDDVSWLIPCNDKYKPIPLNEDDSPVIVGKVVNVLKVNPYNMPSRVCRKMIEGLLSGKSAKLNITDEMVSEAIRVVAPMVTNARQWYAPYRALVDAGVYEKTDYSAFCERVVKVVPDHSYKPKRDELIRMLQKSFKRPVKLWSEDDAPVSGKRFYDYQAIGYKVYEMLGMKL